MLRRTSLVLERKGDENKMFDGYHHMWGMHWGWWIFWVLLIIAVVWAVGFGRSSSRSGTGHQRETPLETLQRRYANGEISTEEYEERKNRLER